MAAGGRAKALRGMPAPAGVAAVTQGHVGNMAWLGELMVCIRPHR